MISAQQKLERRKGLGASDMATVLGLNPWQSAEDIRLDKCGLLEDEPENDAMTAGNYLEPVVIQWMEDRLGPLTRNVTVKHANGIMLANLDAQVATGEPCEGKTTGIVGPVYGNWGTEGSDEVPPMYVIQVQSQMACIGPDCRKGYVGALIGGLGFRLYEIPRSDELIQAIEQRAVFFWNEHVLKRVPAPNSLASLDVLKRVKRNHGEIVNVEERVCDRVRDAKAKADKAKKEYEVEKRRLLTMAGQADAIRYGMEGDIAFTYHADKRGVRSLRIKGELV